MLASGPRTPPCRGEVYSTLLICVCGIVRVGINICTNSYVHKYIFIEMTAKEPFQPLTMDIAMFLLKN